MKKADIIAEVKKRPHASFPEHKELLALGVCSEFFCEPDEETDFEEVLFAVEQDWLVNYMKREYPDWDEVDVRRWLREEYTSYDSIKIYEAALKDDAILMIDFD